MTPPGYFRARWNPQDPSYGQTPLPPSKPRPGDELALVYTERFRRDLVELSPDLYARAVRLVIGLPDRHLNDPHRLMPQDSKVVTLDDGAGLRITYLVVLSLGEIIVARIDRIP